MPAAHFKTLHITNAYHETSGGIRTFYHAVLDAANREGRPFRLVVPAARSSVEDVGPHARIYRVAAPAAPVVDSRYRLLLPHTYLTRRSALCRILIEEQPHLVEITDKYTLPWLAGVLRKGWIRGLRRPVILGLSCERMDDNVRAFVTTARLGQRFARAYMRRLYLPLFDHHVAMSGYIADELRQLATASQRERIWVCTPGVETSRFDPARRSAAARRQMLGDAAGDTARLLFYAGRLSHEKHIPLLVDLLTHLAQDAAADYRLAVAGSGPLAGWLAQAAAARVPGRLRILPHVTSRDDLASLYASSDAFVHPNPREPFGIGPLEAMASGCPLVAPRAGGVLTYASDENAWLAPPSAAGFAEAVRAVFEDPEGRRRKVAAAMETARRYDWPSVVTALFARYDDLCARHVAVAGATLV